MEKIVEMVNNWPFLRQLPQELHGFKLEPELGVDGPLHRILSYENIKARRKFAVVYNQVTKDFMGRVIVGLTEYYDENYIVANLAGLERMLTAKLSETLRQLAYFDKSQLSGIFLATKVLDWPYGRQLPPQIGNFSLFISPQQPLKIINGSYIIIDYSDFNTESSLMILYNIFRDEFFGELRIRRTPHMTNLFDAKTIHELEGKIRVHLVEQLQKVAREAQALPRIDRGTGISGHGGASRSA